MTKYRGWNPHFAGGLHSWPSARDAGGFSLARLASGFASESGLGDEGGQPRVGVEWFGRRVALSLACGDSQSGQGSETCCLSGPSFPRLLMILDVEGTGKVVHFPLRKPSLGPKIPTFSRRQGCPLLSDTDHLSILLHS